MQSDDLITSKFRIQIPQVIQPASRSLAALHATRARLLHHPGPEADILKDTHCTKCGAYLLDGTGTVRLVRKTLTRKKNAVRGPRPYTRVMRRSCGLCGCEEDIPIAEKESETSKDVSRAPRATAILKAPTSLTSSAQASVAHTPTESRLSSVAPSRQPSLAPKTASTLSLAPKPVPTPLIPSASSSKASTPSRQSPAPSQAQTLDARAKSRSKKKTGLQDMLAKNRERREQEKKAGANTGLTAFLQEL